MLKGTYENIDVEEIFKDWSKDFLDQYLLNSCSSGIVTVCIPICVKMTKTNKSNFLHRICGTGKVLALHWRDFRLFFFFFYFQPYKIDWFAQYYNKPTSKNFCVKFWKKYFTFVTIEIVYYVFLLSGLLLFLIASLVVPEYRIVGISTNPIFKNC